MALTNRNLEPGTKLVARYKGTEHRCEVVAGKEEGGKPRYRLPDGREFTSPSAAGSAVMGGVACNGWRFWSLEGELPEPKGGGKAAPKPKAAAKGGAKAKPKRAAKPKAGEDGSGPVSCGECGQEFPNSRETSKHMVDEHGSKEAQPGEKA